MELGTASEFDLHDYRRGRLIVGRMPRGVYVAPNAWLQLGQLAFAVSLGGRYERRKLRVAMRNWSLTLKWHVGPHG